jgi:hypothetical protein
MVSGGMNEPLFILHINSSRRKSRELSAQYNLLATNTLFQVAFTETLT